MKKPRIDNRVKKGRRAEVQGGYPPRTGQISVEQAPGLGDLRGAFNDEDRLQACTERIRIQKYLREKLLPPH